MKNPGATAACCIVLIGFVGVCALMIFKAVPDSPSLQLLVGTLGAMAVSALNFFVGSTQSSKAKDQTIASVAVGKREGD